MAPEFANLRGRETVMGSVSASKSAKSIEASPTKPDFDDPCIHTHGEFYKLIHQMANYKLEKIRKFVLQCLTVETTKW